MLSHAEISEVPQRISTISTTETTAVIEVELSSQGTPPLIVVIEPTSHPEMCCYNITTYLRADTVQFEWEGLSEGTTYTVNVYVENLQGRGPGMQFSFSTGVVEILSHCERSEHPSEVNSVLCWFMTSLCVCSLGSEEATFNKRM